MLEIVQRQIEEARNTPFRAGFKKFVGSRNVPTLSDEEIAMAFHVAKSRESQTTRILDKLPQVAKGRFQEFCGMKTKKGKFFERFIFFSKAPEDGILIGVGQDEMYYVLSVWDRKGADFWQPTQDLFGRPVI